MSVYLFQVEYKFQAMFTGGLKECDMSKVKLQGVCPSAMARLVYFIYTGQVQVTEVTVCQLLPAATMFQVFIVDRTDLYKIIIIII